MALRLAVALPLATAIIRILTPEELAEPDEPWGVVDYKEADGTLVRATVDGGSPIEGNRSATWSRYYGADVIEGDSVTVYIPRLTEITGEFFEETGKLTVAKVARARRPKWQLPDAFDTSGLLGGLEKWVGKEVDVTITETAWKLEGAGIVLEVQRNTSSSGAIDYEHLLFDSPLMCSVTVHIKSAAAKLPVDIATPHIKWYAVDADNGTSQDASGYIVGPVQCMTDVLVTKRDAPEDKPQSVKCTAGTVGEVQFPGWSVSCTREFPKEGVKNTIYVLVNNHNDYLDGELSPSTGRRYGKAILDALLEATGNDPGHYLIFNVQKTFSDDFTVRQYQYDFFDSTGRATREIILEGLRKPGMIDKLSGVVRFTLLRVSDKKWNGRKLSVYAWVNAHNDFLGDEESPDWQVEDSKKDKKFGKAILTTLLAEHSKDPDNYYISHVQKKFTRNYFYRQYGYHFFDFTGKVTTAIILKCLRKPNMLEQINEAVHKANEAVNFALWRVTDKEGKDVKILAERLAESR